MTPDEVRSFVETRQPETSRLDFKRDLPRKTDDEAVVHFARDVCAMANSAGGSIVYGIREEKGCAAEIVGVEIDNWDRESLRLTQVLRRAIEPRLLRFEFSQIPVDEKLVVELHVQQSLFRPHWVVANNDRDFYLRHGASNQPMTYDEIRDAFVHGAGVVERALAWRDKRISSLVSAPEATQFDWKFAWFVLHICPLSAFSGSNSQPFDPRIMHSRRDVDLRTINDYGSGGPSYEGWRIVWQVGSTWREYLTIYRDFKIEGPFVGSDGRVDRQKTIHGRINETKLRTWLQKFSLWAQRVNYPFPAIAFLSVLSAKDSVIEQGNKARTNVISTDLLILQPCFIENSEFDPDTVLRQAYDHLYQSYGLLACPYFDEDGSWNPMRC